MDVGSAENAGVTFCHSIHGDKKMNSEKLKERSCVGV